MPHGHFLRSTRTADQTTMMLHRAREDRTAGKLPAERSLAPISSYFGEMTFTLGDMREHLPQKAYKALLQTLNNGKPLTAETAEVIAQVIKDWAVQKGVTHFCHWFQPMTGLTAEKHDAFISIQHSEHSELKVMERFSGSQLIQGEPDASSFPSGGIRSTFEARGYTVWDPTSPLFIVEGETGRTLCVPSVFFGYNGEALDYKTPLLRSTRAISTAATEFLKLLGDVDTKRVAVTLGAEQEYFLIDSHYAAKRPDIVMTGKTVLGAQAPKGQELEDHYFGSVPNRVKAFWEDLERELYRLGIPVKTRHNEVAPSQFEMAPIFEDVNIAIDHNILTMDTLKAVAKRHGFVCLLNEKPFKGINGSGKHCNWSMSNDKGENLLEPGKTPHQNLRFLAMVSIILRAVHRHADTLLASVASPGNDWRLGLNEAPPAILSVYVGSLLDKILDSFAQEKSVEAIERSQFTLGVAEIPQVARDYTDRNRTSPFAFTGNKFEFRAVGSSANPSMPVTILNAAVTESLQEATERLKELLKTHETRDQATIALIREFYMGSKDIIFSGNNYSGEWREEAKRRKLPVYERITDALEIFDTHASTKFLVDTQVLRETEIESRYHLLMERYNSTLTIELQTMLEMVRQYSIPGMERQLTLSHKALEGVISDTLKGRQRNRVAHMEGVMSEMIGYHDELQTVMSQVRETEDLVSKKRLISGQANQIAEKLRSAADEAETMISHDFWDLPRYREMLFSNVFS